MTKYYLKECINKVEHAKHPGLLIELREAMELKSRMSLFNKIRNGFEPKISEAERIKCVLEKYGVLQHLIIVEETQKKDSQ